MSSPNRYGSAVVTVPNALEVVVTRKFDAAMTLVFDVATKAEHVRIWFVPAGYEMTECSFDLRAGGDYHELVVSPDGTEHSFHGTYLEVDPPHRVVSTAAHPTRPDTQTIEAMILSETDGVTTVTTTVTYTDTASRDAAVAAGFDGVQLSYDRMQDLLFLLQS